MNTFLFKKIKTTFLDEIIKEYNKYVDNLFLNIEDSPKNNYEKLLKYPNNKKKSLRR